MMGGALPPCLLAVTLGLALAGASRRAALSGLCAFAVMAAAMAFLPLPSGWRQAVFLGCWASAAALAACTHLPRGLGPACALAAGADAGLWAGAAISMAGRPVDLIKAAACAGLALLAAAVVRMRLPIAVKVVSSWLIAVAVLAALLAFLPVTPGYLPDHLD